MSLPRVRVGIKPLNWTGSRRFMNPGELEALVALMDGATRVIEFGCNEGRTAKVLMRHVPTIKRYVGIDVLPGYITDKPVQRREVPADPGHLAKGDPRFQLFVSERGSFDFKLEPRNPELVFDAAFIDGDHGWRGVLHDTMLARQLVRPGGIIVWHDYHDRGNVDVREVLEILHVTGSKISAVEDTWLAFERV